jgi:LacI family transcriptional regulator
MPSLRDLAKASGFSLVTASRALHNDPLVRAETQELIAATAKKIGYEVNPFVGKFMSSMRRQQKVGFKGALAIIWHDPPIFPKGGMLTQIREAATNRALELGYCADEFSLSDYRSDRLIKILQCRGIRGLLISPPLCTVGKTRLRLDVSSFASVTLGWALLHPFLHTTRVDHYRVMQMALHHARHKFGRGIAVFCGSASDRRADHSWKAAFLAHHPAGEAIAGKLFFDSANPNSDRIMPILQKYRVRSIITESLGRVPDWVHTEVPKENLIYLSDPGETPCSGWINQRWDLSGTWGIDLLTACMERREYGIPTFQKVTLVPPQWIEAS